VKFVGESLLITLREGFEAALVIAIVVAAVRRGSRPAMVRWVWAGTAAALGFSIALGVVLHLTVDGLDGRARQEVFAAICLAAAALLTWMVFWMRSHSRTLRHRLEGQVQDALGHSALALAGVAFLAVAREGLETALFLVSSTTSASPGDVLTGGLLGLALACVLGVAVYHGSRAVPLRGFFQVTGVLIIVLAAGLVSRSVQLLQAAGDLGSVDDAAYNLTGVPWLTIHTQTGEFLAGIFGWDPRPSVEQVVVYLLYLVPVAAAFLLARPRTRSTRARPWG